VTDRHLVIFYSIVHTHSFYFCDAVDYQHVNDLCFFDTHIVPDKVQRAVKWLCVIHTLSKILDFFVSGLFKCMEYEVEGARPIIVFFSQHMPIPSQPVLL